MAGVYLFQYFSHNLLKTQPLDNMGGGVSGGGGGGGLTLFLYYEIILYYENELTSLMSMSINVKCLLIYGRHYFSHPNYYTHQVGKPSAK